MKNMKNWLTEQVSINTEQWDRSLVTFYPEAKKWMCDPISYSNHLTVTCNYLNAVKLIDWDNYLNDNSTILDIGCGGGWLTAYLSNKSKIKKIIALDSSENYLQNFLPKVVSHLNGNLSKVETIQALFTPVLLDANSVDMIVISSALHHADNINFVLSEFERVLKPGGYLIILNETPNQNFKYLYHISSAFLKILYKSLFKKHERFSQKISLMGFLYDPYLGDVDFPIWYWEKSIKEAKFQLVQVLDTKLQTVVKTKGRSLKHFICKK